LAQDGALADDLAEGLDVSLHEMEDLDGSTLMCGARREDHGQLADPGLTDGGNHPLADLPGEAVSYSRMFQVIAEVFRLQAGSRPQPQARPAEERARLIVAD
jgi:hypothetical protein